MREIFLEYAKVGAMTKEDICKVMKFEMHYVGGLVRKGILKPANHCKPQKFDPMQVYEALFGDPKQARSLTTEKRKSGGNPKTGGFRKCL